MTRPDADAKTPLSTFRRCPCTVEDAEAWLDLVAGAALDGDTDAKAALPQVLAHYLLIVKVRR